MYKKGKGDVSEKEVRDVIRNLLELRGGKISARELAKESGISRRVISRLLPQMKEEM